MNDRHFFLKIAIDVKCFCAFGPGCEALFDLVREGFIEEMGGEWFRKTERAFNQ